MTSRTRALIAILIAITVTPGALVSFRIKIIESFAKKIGAKLVAPYLVSDPICNSNYCSREYRFKSSDTQGAHDNWIGFYNAFLSGTVISNGELAHPLIERLLKKPPNWYQFQRYQIHTDSDASIISAAPVGRKKIGMDLKYAFFASEDVLSSIHTVHSLFNIHIYLALSALALIITGALRLSYISKKITRRYSHTLFSGILVSASCLLYSHVFDLIVFHIGVPSGQIENAAKWVWGPTVLFLLFNNLSVAAGMSATYIVAIAFAGGMSQSTTSTFYLAYPLIVAALSVVMIAVAGVRLWRGEAYLTLPLSFLLFDALVINGFIPLISTTYLSPLCFVGWFSWNHREGLRTLLNITVFGRKHETLTRRLSEIRSIYSSTGNHNFLSIIERLTSALANAVDANRASIIIFKEGRPVIARYVDGQTSLIMDGLTPPIFARVIQTKEEMFLVNHLELISIKNRSGTEPLQEVYSGSRSIVLPIIDGDRTIGAIAVTDFMDEAQLVTDEYQQNHITDLLSVIKSEISNMDARSNHEHERNLSDLQEVITREFIQQTTETNQASEVYNSFCKILYAHTQLSTVIFNFDSTLRAANFLTSFGLSDVAALLWQQEPYFASKENKLSPIAIAVNEERSVYISDIRTFFGFLKSKSIAALTASVARGFAVLPIHRFGKVTGVIFVLQPVSSESTHDMGAYRFLDKYTDLLAVQLYQAEVAAKSTRQERALQKIIEPALIETVLAHRERGEQVAGVVEQNFLFLLDLRGSTPASRKFTDPLELAKRLSRIYEKADSLVRSHGGYFEKGSGDGLLFTLKDDLEVHQRVCSLLIQLEITLGEVAKMELGVEHTIMIAHYGNIFRGIMGSSARMAWDNCGVDLINTFDIEKKAKNIGGVVFAISNKFKSRLNDDVQALISTLASGKFNFDSEIDEVFVFDESSRQRLHNSLTKLVGNSINRLPSKIDEAA